ncbi:HAD family hydrolase [Salipaludibacillus neizhouensis]|uniref:HAD family hydrolase n=1 Tax=Salipaludibacillus neizhouensis TaxID=885475 RepID=A0A3A9K4C0_9BACI|nr:HAD family hydrolase [Salipaludibacillus neizhouensis]RKL65151.1 HAD family hydrolase [Salipaludibacillus neizhouensis]
MTRQIKALIFDWGDTLMWDFPELDGPMAYWEKIEAVPGMNHALEMACKDYICCVASNAGDSTTELMGEALNRVDLRKYFNFLFTSRELGVTKPNLDFFNKIVSNLHLKPEECIMIGNDYEKEIVPSKAVGMHTIFFTEERKRAVFMDADYTINSMNNLYEIIMDFEDMNNIHTV